MYFSSNAFCLSALYLFFKAQKGKVPLKAFLKGK